MAKNLNVYPYFDDYDASKKYTQILAVPGRVIQAREFTQAQTLLNERIGQIGDAIFTNGTIISGCSISTGSASGVKFVRLEEGKIYLGGAVRDIPQTTLNIGGLGYEYVCASVQYQIVTEETDSSLKDNYPDSENYNQSGSHRLKETVSLMIIADENSEYGIDSSVTSSVNAAKLYTLYNGVVLQEGTTQASGNSNNVNVATTDVSEDVIDTLARRTFDENGSFKLKGLKVVDAHECDDEGIVVNVESGKAYVNGYEVLKVANSRIYVDYETSTKKINNETYKSKSGVTEYLLSKAVAAAIHEVDWIVRTQDNVTRTTTYNTLDPDDDYNRDALPHDVVYEIISITDNSSKTYTNGVDYQLVENNRIEWQNDSNCPSSGSSYTVVYNYVKTQDTDVDGETDVKLVTGWNDETEVYESKIQFLNPSTYPVVNTDIHVDYSYYLNRADLILLTKDGEFEVVKGKPNRTTRIVLPVNNDVTKMAVGTVIVMAGYSGEDVDEHLKRLHISQSGLVRLAQQDLYYMKDRLDNLEYNQAMTDLDQEALQGEAATTLRGIFTDGFIGFTKSDVSYDSNGVSYSAAIDADNGELTLSEIPYSQTLKLQKAKTTARNLRNHYVAYYTGENTTGTGNYIAINQNVATQAFKVNPYAAYEPMCLLEVNPSVDSWVDEEEIQVEGKDIVQKVGNLRRWWAHPNASWAEEERQKWIELTGTDGAGEYGVKEKASVYNGTQSTFKVTESLINYMRRRYVLVQGSNYRPNADGYVCYFNGSPVALTAVKLKSTAETGSIDPDDYEADPENQGTAVTVKKKSYAAVKTNAKGEFTAKFRIPKNVPCGTVNVEVRSNLEGSSGGGVTTYTAEGRLRTTTETVRAIKVNFKAVDPLAQSFQFTESRIIYGIDLYFARKDETKNLLVQVRNMQNGFPGSEIYKEIILKPENINVSDNGSVLTFCKFPTPFYCAENTRYCFVVLSDSNEYELWIATVGDTKISTTSTAVVASQPYGAGLMFSSSNSDTWTAHQSSDLKFRIRGARFEYMGEVGFQQASFAQSVNRLLLAAQSEDYKNDGIFWYYKDAATGAEDTEWHTINPYSEIELDTMSSKFEVKCELNPGENQYTSAILDSTSVVLAGFRTVLEGTYVSRAVFFDNTYNTLVITLEAALPTLDTKATSFALYYSIDNVNWIQLNPVNNTRVDSEFTKYEYKVEDIPNASSYRIRIDLRSTDPRIRPRIRKLTSVMRNE